MVKVVRKKHSNFSFPPVGFLIFFLLIAGAAYVTFQLAQKNQSVRQFAASSPTATISLSPSSQSVNVGSTFTVNMVVDGGGQAFNAAQATVAVSSNLSVVSVNTVASTSGGCNFKYVDSATPSTSNLSFAGAILASSSTNCTVYSVTLSALSQGTGSVTIANGSVKAFSDNSEIFSSSTNGTYTVGSGITPTATTTPTPTLAPGSASESLVPSNQAVAQGATFKVSVHENSGATQINAAQAIINYPSSLQFVGFDDTTVVPNFSINAQETSTTSQITIAKGSITPLVGDQVITTLTFTALQSGQAQVTFDTTNSKVFTSANNANILSTFTNGTYTINSTVTPTPTNAPQCIATTHLSGDINGDSHVDIFDLSILFRVWNNTAAQLATADAGGDLNCDGVVNLTDFSILAKFWQG